MLIHGLGSKPQAWDQLTRLIEADDELAPLVSLECFEYDTRLVGSWPLTTVPTYRTVADKLRTRYALYREHYESIVFVTHSQGGLVLQTFLSRMLIDGAGLELGHIHGIVLIACPNGGSGIFLNTRRLAGLFIRHGQEQRLRPLDEEVADIHRHVSARVDGATAQTSTEYSIPIVAYAAERDGIVTRASAYGSFRRHGVLPGTHKTVIRPRSHQDPGYVDLRAHLLSLLDARTAEATSSQTLPASQAPIRAERRTTNLPRRPASDEVVGRETEIARLTALLLDLNTDIVLIDGPSGAGKTTLAVSVCHQLLTDESAPVDAVFWLPVRSSALHADELSEANWPADLDDLTATIALTLDRRDLMHLNLAERAAGVRVALADVECIILLDNFETARDVRLLPYLRALPQSCTVLITSRRQIDASARLHLAPLGLDATVSIARVELTRRGISYDEDTVFRIAKMSGGLPLAVTWLIAHLALGAQHLEPRTRELNDDELLHFLFSGSLAQLDESTGVPVLLLASLPTNGVPTPVLEMVIAEVGLSAHEGARSLAEVTTLNLMEFVPETKRYEVLPIIKRFLADGESRGDLTFGISVGQIERAYAAAWSAHLRSESETLWRVGYAVSDWDLDRSNVISSLRSASLDGYSQAAFLDAFYPFAITFGHFTEFLDLTQLFFERNVGSEPRVVASLRARRASILLHSGFVKAAELELDLAESAFAAISDPGYILTNLVNFVRAIVDVTSRAPDAESTLRSAIEFEELHGETWARLGFQGWLGLHLINEGRLLEAEDLLRRALAECHETGDLRTSVFIQVGLARLHLASGQHSELLLAAPGILDVAARFGEEHNRAHLHLAIARAHAETGNTSSALAHTEKAEMLYLQLGAGLDLARCAELKAELAR
ncbi:AAA family ATPase [Nostocoides australiense]